MKSFEIDYVANGNNTINNNLVFRKDVDKHVYERGISFEDFQFLAFGQEHLTLDLFVKVDGIAFFASEHTIFYNTDKVRLYE